MNTSLVPQYFIEEENSFFATGKDDCRSRLFIEVRDPADTAIARYIEQMGYEPENDKLDSSKTTHILKLITGIIIGIGLLICLLAFYILMLSIFLLLQKNTTKLTNLILIGYTPRQVARPYQSMTIGLNCVIFA